MINISIIQYGGMSYRVLHELAKRFDKKIFNVNFLWCRPGIDLHSSFKHAIPSEEEIKKTVVNLEKSNVKVIEFKVQERFIPDPNLPWLNTNFWNIYNSISTDVVFCWKSGRAEYPFCHLLEPVIEWNIFGGYDPSINLFSSLAVSPFCREEHIKNGGDSNKSKVVFLPLTETFSKKNLRKTLNISPNSLVIGMHQREEDTIFSPIFLIAAKNAIENLNFSSDLIVLVLGGSKKYKELGNKLGLKIIQLDSKIDYDYVSQFLNTLDIFTHSRKDGETLGAAIQEAMAHSLPVISHTSQWNAHIDTLGPGGIVCESQNHYNETLINWIKDKNIRDSFGLAGKKYSIERYTWKSTLTLIENEIINAFNLFKPLKYKPVALSIYKKRKIIMIFRFYFIKIATKVLIYIFGQKGSQYLSKAKRLLFFINKI